MAELNDHLLILWTTDNKDTALHMVFMFAENSKIHGWLKDITLLIWGASSKLAATDEEIQKHIRFMREQQNSRVIACKQCAEDFGIVEALEKHGVEVFYTGDFLADWLKDGKKLITI